MGKKIFVSYKHLDSQVQDLNIYEDEKDFFGIIYKKKITTTVRNYVDIFESKLEDEDDIYKGESDGEDLSDKSEQVIEEILKDRIFDSSVTVVFISKGMKENYAENKQWIPWEICYSIKKITRGGRTSQSNAILCVVIPDSNGSYEYLITTDTDCNCTNYKTYFLFPILKKNMFNIKNPNTSICKNQTVYHGYSSYFHMIKWEDFEKNYKSQINISLHIKNNIEDYVLCKELED